LDGVEGGVEERALMAARTVAAAQGLSSDGAVVLQSRTNVLIHLRPAPVVARVMTGTIVLHANPRQWLDREVSVLRFLAPSGLAVAPSSLIAPGPYEQDGLWMVFCEWWPQEKGGTHGDDAAELGRLLRRLHDELLAFSGDLGDFGDLREDIERVHRLLRPTASVSSEMIESLRTRLRALDDAVFRTSLPTQALHGDASLGNLLRTPDGPVWNDFEDTVRGPVHWDVAGYLVSLRARFADGGFARRALRAYGWGDERELTPFTAAHAVYDEIWQLYDRQRRAPFTGS
jgi:aminoglycoside phosphotransferase (APT) family kinase protein